MHEATVGHQGKLNFRVESTLSNPSLPIEVLIVTAELPGLLAAKRVWDFDGWLGLLSFFDELARNWRGWDGEISFASIEGDLRLTAKHEGHVRIAFELEEFAGPTPWRAQGELALDPGEELKTAAESLRNLLTSIKP